MDEQFERLASLDELNRWGRMARRFFPLLEPKVVTEPRPMLLVGGYEILTDHDWSDFWYNEVYDQHLNDEIAELMVPPKPDINELISKLEKKKKKKRDDS